eukprot:CAMPEP_0174242860 /NCGR_PEP_ID=MMETSP0417-20130205/29420_1 /TAXON_ID=242541 /ORGANISM="Mayorella sp, Strain BSH-02190019" /LENGTH=31 /DNA_ID= /DNA_START= /DNA_END= /DNA_ORIENTATION=
MAEALASPDGGENGDDVAYEEEGVALLLADE